MEFTTLFSHPPPPDNAFFQIRKDYLKICRGDMCAAIILRHLETRSLHIIGSQEWLAAEFEAASQAGMPFPEHLLDSLWVRGSSKQLASDLWGMFSLHQINKAMKLLMELGFVARQNHPIYKGERAWYWRIEQEAVQGCINALIPDTPTPEVINIPTPHEAPQVESNSDLPDDTVVDRLWKHAELISGYEFPLLNKTPKPSVSSKLQLPIASDERREALRRQVTFIAEALGEDRAKAEIEAEANRMKEKGQPVRWFEWFLFCLRSAYLKEKKQTQQAEIRQQEGDVPLVGFEEMEAENGSRS